MNKLQKHKWLCLFFILTAGLLLRLYHLNAPLADWHSWRQADTSAVSRNYIKNGIDLLSPRFDDLSNIPSGKDNPQGYRFVEFPLYNLIQTVAFHSFPQVNLEVWGRLISIFFSLASIIILFLLVRLYLDDATGLLAALFYAILPYNVYYGRVVLPEPLMIFCALFGIYNFSIFIEKQTKPWRYFNLLLGFIFFAISLLIKPFVGVYIFPIIYLTFRKYRLNMLKYFPIFIAASLTLVPFFLWRLWMGHHPEGIPANNLLFNENNIRFKGAYFYWIFAERISKLILGYWGIILLVFGLIVKNTKREGGFFYAWLFGILTYLVVIAAGNVRHDYYQILIMPIVCIFLAKGATLMLNVPLDYFHRWLSRLALLITVVFMLAFSWYQVRDYFIIYHPEIVEAGKAVDKLIPQNALVIAPYFGDTAFLYQTKRQGWPMITSSLQELINKGAEYYVSVKFDPETQAIMQKYIIVQQSSNFVIVKLSP